jgi:hypothetical protein
VPARVAAAVEPTSRRGRRAVRVECFARAVPPAPDTAKRAGIALLLMEQIRQRVEARQASRPTQEMGERG